MTQRERPTRAFAKPSGDELSKISQGELVQFVAASVGRVSNLYPHWLLLHVETPLGIPSSRLMVLWLLHSWNEISMGEISRAIDLTPRGVTRIVDGLEEEGLARRAPHKTDKRIKVVRLTNKGHRFVENTFPVARAEFKQLFSVLEKGECLEFIRLLEKVTDEMKNQIDAEQVSKTNGGVPPVGHTTQLRVFVDPDQLHYGEVWAAAGTWNDNFAIAPKVLVRVSGGVVTDLKLT